MEKNDTLIMQVDRFNVKRYREKGYKAMVALLVVKKGQLNYWLKHCRKSYLLVELGFTCIGPPANVVSYGGYK
ncbi:hypothetical protein KFK09_017844 [Dendrobium nobile]|uniref:Uncharacterized protein n=1 Tax=Dendrobium nobile TaxID=94219 RepID=A0A8T3ASM1_DENNO|nr:hypothetical protein KFK09_017844 [Dendrobium nobile]